DSNPSHRFYAYYVQVITLSWSRPYMSLSNRLTNIAHFIGCQSSTTAKQLNVNGNGPSR
ncbi:hypothetical protein SeMB42_g06764, partial [Synchytrium endobioticum]